MTRKVVSPIALDKSINTTEQTPRNIADVLAQQLAAIKTAIESGNGNLEAAFVCYYGVTTATQIKDAIDDGKVPYFYYNGAVAQLWKVETDKYTFRTTNTRSVEGQTILDVVDYVVNGSVWSTITREVSGGSSSGQSYIASVNSLADFDTTGKSGMQDLVSVMNVPADGVYQVSVMLHITPKTAIATKSDLVLQFTSSDNTGWPSHTFHAVVDDSQTFAQQLSFSTSVSLKAGQNTLRIQCGDLNTEYLVFVDELTLAQLVNGVYHNGDDFDEVHTLTETADFNNDDGVLVDGATGGPRFMLWQTLANKVLGFIKSLFTTATEADLVAGNYLPLDGSSGTKKLPAEDVAKRSEAVFFYNDKVNSYIKELYVVSARVPKYVELTPGVTILWLRVLDENKAMIAQFDTAYNGVVRWTQKAADTTAAWAVLTDDPTFGVPWGENQPEIIRSCEIMNCPIIKAHFMDDDTLGSAKDYTDEQIAEVEEEIDNIYTTVYTNLEPTMAPALSMLTFKPVLDGDHYNYVMDSSGYGESGSWVYLGFKITEVWKKNHSYFIAIDLEVVTDSKTTGGNFYGKLRAKGPSTSNNVSSEVTPVAGVVNGTRGNLKGVFTINDNIDTYPTADNFILQAGKYTNTESLELNIYNVCVIDMGIEGLEGYKSYEEVDALFNLYGYTAVAKMIANCNHAVKADMAKTVETMAVGGDIDLWGDSLVAQNYGAIIGTILGRTVISHGFGGKKSAYIRDQFLAYSNKNNTIVINVGRNDTGAGNADIVFQNIAAMVAAIPHQRFLICCPPNGNYNGEGKGGTTYKFFEDLEERLAKAYPANFLNSRENTIFAYDMGDVKLTASFTKPNLNGSVTISVSDASFLTTYNSKDIERWGETNAKKVAIGHTIDACDIYAVTAHDDVNNTLTLTLLESNSDVASGNTFENYTNEGAVNYARVLQYFDYICWNDDRTQSTFRSDGIHMSAYGKECIAKVLARKIYEMHI